MLEPLKPVEILLKQEKDNICDEVKDAFTTNERKVRDFTIEQRGLVVRLAKIGGSV